LSTYNTCPTHESVVRLEPNQANGCNSATAYVTIGVTAYSDVVRCDL